MPDISEIWNEVKKNVTDYAEAKIQEAVKESKSDAKRFLNLLKDKGEKYSAAYIRGDLDKDDLEWLLLGIADLTEMKALEKRGLTKVRIQRFTNGLVDVVLDTLLKAI